MAETTSDTRHDFNATVDGSGIRQRLPAQPSNPQQAKSPDAAKHVVAQLNAEEEETSKDEKDRKTFGRTPGGVVFTVPTTHDMVSTLFSPTEPKNVSDLIVLVILSMKVIAVLTLPRTVTVPLFAVLFLFWRACYNAGIGWLLHEQSHYNTLVDLAKRTSIFEKPDSGKNKYPQFYKLLKRELQTKIPKDYNFETAPIEYNTWLLFRRVVDLVLMSDFTSYCCFAAACGGTPAGENFLMTMMRWVIGISLILFNLWVKLDAHRVVKDFAWYWGDFFFLIDQELTFDGVFEMAPHPMYSVGYAGFYGISLMAASYRVLAISIIGHAAQFAFLTFVESPHIEKTYNPPAPRKRTMTGTSEANLVPAHTLAPDSYGPDSDAPNATTPNASIEEAVGRTNHPPFVRAIIGLHNLDLHRVIDLASLVIQFYYFSLALLTPSTIGYQIFFVVNAALWRLWYSLGIGYILDRQSKKKSWTRHFIKWGDTAEYAWRQWKGVYHLSMVMSYVTFVAAAFKMYHLPEDWQIGMSTLRHVIGTAMIALQLWTLFSIYDSLGEFGWFFGDFFFDDGPKLTYGGIYRFLNQPERVIGLAGVWGFALITWSKAIFFLAALSHILTLFFLQYIERPHMQRRYGQSIRQSSGVSTTFKKSLPRSLQKWQGTVDRALDDAIDSIEELIEAARPRLTAGVETLIQDTQTLFRQYPARIQLTRLAQDMPEHDLAKYSLSINSERLDAAGSVLPERASGREGLLARTASFRGSQFTPVVLEYGAPITVTWTAPATHSPHDWIGLYMLADVNASRSVTRISSQGRWIATTKGKWDGNGRAEQGILSSDSHADEDTVRGAVQFAGDKLWWTTGVFELRLHHAGAHNVLARSAPFEVRVPRFEDVDLGVPSAADPAARAAVEQALLRLVRNCFDRDPDVAPERADEPFGELVERDGKFARRVVFAVWHAFGVEFAPPVVKSDGTVRNLAWRIVNAKQVLAPYSMSNSRGTVTPTEEDK